jgi:hypothetical protein
VTFINWRDLAYDECVSRSSGTKKFIVERLASRESCTAHTTVTQLSSPFDGAGRIILQNLEKKRKEILPQ